MNNKNTHIIYFLGIGGIGMSALARYFSLHYINVFGYDRTKTALCEQLEKEGMIIHYHENISLIPENIDFVVYTPAIPDDNVELQFFRKNGMICFKRAELLGYLLYEKFTIAVAGTHGKTTITSLITHILKFNNERVTAFLGGIAKNYSSNLVYTTNAKYYVVEADEYDRSFLNLYPNIAVVSSIDPDHLDIYGSEEKMCQSYRLFINQITGDGLIYQANIDVDDKIKNKTSYSIDERADYYATNIRIIKNHYLFDVCLPKGETIIDIELKIGGRHNIENALAAIVVSYKLGLETKNIKKALNNYNGVVRRFDVIFQSDECIYIDDYAHHPEEIKTTIKSVRELYYGKKITVIFQPHLYTRTRDFLNEFAESLALIDEVILLPIYPAREKPIKGINSELLLGKINIERKELLIKDEVVSWISKNKPQVLITMGAGDIDQLINPIKKQLKTKNN